MSDGSPFIAMKLVEGRTLAGLLAERGGSAHDLQKILRIFELVCQTVAYAHSRGVVHRDLKPSNIMVGAFGEVQVMDWGLACEPAREAREEAPPGAIMGTPGYMAPEQARGDPADARADVFSLGAILCEILTGVPPSPGGDGELPDGACSALTRPALDRLRDEAGGLAELTCLCLLADPAARPADAGVLATALSEHQAGVQERLRRAEIDCKAAELRAVAERRWRRFALGVVVAAAHGAADGLDGLGEGQAGRGRGRSAGPHSAVIGRRSRATWSLPRTRVTSPRSSAGQLGEQAGDGADADGLVFEEGGPAGRGQDRRRSCACPWPLMRQAISGRSRASSERMMRDICAGRTLSWRWRSPTMSGSRWLSSDRARNSMSLRSPARLRPRGTTWQNRVTTSKNWWASSSSPVPDSLATMAIVSLDVRQGRYAIPPLHDIPGRRGCVNVEKYARLKGMGGLGRA